MSKVAITRAIVSVYDKTGLDQLAAVLHKSGVEIVSTGSTAEVIAAAGVPVTRVEDVTGFPECLAGRVKTLHPGVHAGLLADLRDPGHVAQLDQLEIAPFQLLVSNLYPFERTVAAGATDAESIEQIDIGGPAMVRAAAKNHANVAVVTSPDAYPELEAALEAGGFTVEQRRRLAAQAFARTASYDAAVANWFASRLCAGRDRDGDRLAGRLGRELGQKRRTPLRREPAPARRPLPALSRRVRQPRPSIGVANAEQLGGKAMSYNNYVDADSAWRTVREFAEPCVAIMKHSNPCGIALGADIAEAHRKAHACDPVSAFGGVIAANRQVTAELAAQIAEIFTEVIIAPGYDQAALEILTKKKNQRLLRGSLQPQPTPLPAPAGRRPWSSGGRSAVACSCRRPTWRPSRGIAPPAGNSLRGTAGGRRRTRRPGVRLASLPVGQVERDPAGGRRCLGRRRHGPGQPSRCGQARGGQGGRPSRRRRRGERCVLPVRRRPASADRRRRDRDRRARRLGPRPRGDRGRPASRRHPLLHRRPPLLALI